MGLHPNEKNTAPRSEIQMVPKTITYLSSKKMSHIFALISLLFVLCIISQQVFWNDKYKQIMANKTSIHASPKAILIYKKNENTAIASLQSEGTLYTNFSEHEHQQSYMNRFYWWQNTNGKHWPVILQLSSANLY